VYVLTLWGPTENVQQVRCNQKNKTLHLFRFLFLLCIIIIIKCSFIWGMISLLTQMQWIYKWKLNTMTKKQLITMTKDMPAVNKLREGTVAVIQHFDK